MTSRRELMKVAAMVPGGLLAQSGAPEAALRKMLEPPNGRVPAVIDTDTYNEIDDQYAVAYGLLSPERMDVEAIYAAPSERPLNQSGRRHGEELPGDSAPPEVPRQGIGGIGVWGSDRFFGGDRKPVESPAVRDLIARAMKPHPTPLYVLTLGCPVNVSSEVLIKPKIKEKIVRM